MKKALPSPIAAEGIHEEVISLLIAEKRGKVLDVPAGQGALTLKLKEMGFEVYAADISPESFVVEDIECKRVDLNKSLPYADGAFDYIVCVEGIEHLENPFLTLREFSRILEPEGKIILTTPNILNLRARLSYLFFGHPGVCFKPIYQQIKEGTATFNLHISPLSFFTLAHFLKNYHFKIEGIFFNSYIKKRRRYFLLKVWILFIQWYHSWHRKESFPYILFSSPLLYGNILIVKARKTAE